MMKIMREMEYTLKWVGLLLILALMSIAIGAINRDRAESDREWIQAQQAEQKDFQAAMDRDDKEFNDTVEELAAAIAGLNASVKSFNRNLQQTRPRHLEAK